MSPQTRQEHQAISRLVRAGGREYTGEMSPTTATIPSESRA